VTAEITTIPEFRDVVTTSEQLHEILGQPSKTAAEKAIPALDRHCRDFIERSPFLLIATADASGSMDVSPKGDPAGFVRILDNNTIAIPDRKGNRRADTFSNILENPKVGLFFMVPGYRETLRVTGTAIIVRDLELRESMAVKGSIPELALVVNIDEVFFHCAKCVIRSGLWDADNWNNVDDMSRLADALVDQTSSEESAHEMNERIEESYEVNLY
jgi:hypothetical protein